MGSQEATLKEVAHIRFRRLLARNETFNCAEFGVGCMVLFRKAQNRLKSWRLMKMASLYRFRAKPSKLLILAYVVV